MLFRSHLPFQLLHICLSAYVLRINSVQVLISWTPVLSSMFSWDIPKQKKGIIVIVLHCVAFLSLLMLLSLNPLHITLSLTLLLIITLWFPFLFPSPYLLKLAWTALTSRPTPAVIRVFGLFKMQLLSLWTPRLQIRLRQTPTFRLLSGRVSVLALLIVFLTLSLMITLSSFVAFLSTISLPMSTAEALSLSS